MRKTFYVVFWILASTTIFSDTGSDNQTEIENVQQEERLPLRELRIFTQVFEQVRRGYVDEVKDSQLLENAVMGLLLELDPHSAYLGVQEYKTLQESASGQYGGLGIEISADQGLLKIIAPIDDSPAKKAGIQSGDIIVEINNQPVRGLALPKAIDKLRGNEGSSIDLKILREGKDNPLNFTLVRDIIYASAVRSRVLEAGIGYIRIAQFQEDSDKDFIDALNRLKEESASDSGLKGLVIDLRNNPGGLVPAAVQISDVLLDKGLIVYTEGRLPSANQSFVAQPGDLLKEISVVVLINGGSASASEIVAGAFQHHKRALILGTQSFGKGSVQTVIPLGDGRAIKLTTARYFTPSGRSIQAEGIVPDIIIPRAEIRLLESNSHMREEDLEGHLKKVGISSSEPKPNEYELDGDNQLREAINILKGVKMLEKN